MTLILGALARAALLGCTLAAPLADLGSLQRARRRDDAAARLSSLKSLTSARSLDRGVNFRSLRQRTAAGAVCIKGAIASADTVDTEVVNMQMVHTGVGTARLPRAPGCVTP